MNISTLLATPLFWTMIFSVVFFSYLTISTLKNTTQPKVADNGTSLILSGILVFAVIIFLVWHKRDEIAWSLQEHQDLMTTKGTITKSEIYYQSKGWHFDIWYDYNIDGALYKSNQVSYGYTGSSDKSFATSYVNKYTVGKSVIVYYDPFAHEKSVLEPDVFNYDWIFVTIQTIPLGIFFIANGLSQKTRPTKRAPDAGDSAAISSSFLSLFIFLAGRLRRPRPSAGNANRWAFPYKIYQNPKGDMKANSKIIILSVIVMTLACNVFTPTPIPMPLDESIVNCIETPLGLVSWWRGEGNATDSTGHYDGMFVSNSVFALGKVGQAFSFNGIDNLVAVPDSDEWTLGVNDFTLDMWVNFNDIKSRTAFIGHDEGGGSTNKWIFWYDEFGDDGSPGPALRFHINPSTGLRNPIFAAWTPAIGQWYHIAITRNTSAYAIYIDGKQAATSIHTDEITNADAPLTIGSSEGFFFNGLIDEVHFFSRGLSSSEIQGIFNAGNSGICLP